MRRAFTLLELVFVVVIIGLLANFGTSLLMTTYTSFTASTVNNRMQVNTDLTLKQISNRLRYRLRGSVIQRSAVGAVDITPIQVPFAGAGIPRDLEWIGIDSDGLLGSAGTFAGWYQPTWSGFIDIGDAGARASNAQAIPLPPFFLESPGSNFAQANTVIQAVNSNPVAGAGTGIAQAAIFFVGENSNVLTGYGWQGAINTQFNVAAHPVFGLGTQLRDSTGTSFSGVDIYERYHLSWTAYSISLEDWDGDNQGPGPGPLRFDDLVLRYDYQPWNGQNANTGAARLLLTNVDSFKFKADGDVISVQICVNEDNFMNGGQYSLCEEIAIF